eukprot:4419500-Pyramimonas_sp.AAC.1
MAASVAAFSLRGSARRCASPPSQAFARRSGPGSAGLAVQGAGQIADLCSRGVRARGGRLNAARAETTRGSSRCVSMCPRSREI